MFTDGAWGWLSAGTSNVLVSPLSTQSKYTARLEFKATNNTTEYEGLILGLDKAKVL